VERAANYVAVPQPHALECAVGQCCPSRKQLRITRLDGDLARCATEDKTGWTSAVALDESLYPRQFPISTDEPPGHLSSVGMPNQ